MNIYVGNLAYSVTEQQLAQAFSEFGTVSSAKLIVDRDTGRAKGFGFVEMPDKAEGIKAIAGMNGRELNNRPIVVNEARPREERGGFGGQRGNGRGNFRQNRSGYNDRW